MMTLVGIVKTEEVVREMVKVWVDGTIKEVTDPKRSKFKNTLIRELNNRGLGGGDLKDLPELSEEVGKELVDELTMFWIKRLI